MIMSDVRFLIRAIDIARILGLHDRTITRWSLKGKVERKERGKYCLLSVF
ncbi:MAG: type IV toxin-antitoxin system AbiEi family antitoxin domain-containing protein, partial [Prochloraceae cyanobacterium]